MHHAVSVHAQADLTAVVSWPPSLPPLAPGVFLPPLRASCQSLISCHSVLGHTHVCTWEAVPSRPRSHYLDLRNGYEVVVVLFIFFLNK